MKKNGIQASQSSQPGNQRRICIHLEKLRATEGPNVYVAAESRPDTMPNQSAAKEHRANGTV
jgi:hypothetical protein